VFIGYDPRESGGHQSKLAHSIHARSSQPVSIAPLMLSELKGGGPASATPCQSTGFFFFTLLLTTYLSVLPRYLVGIRWTATC